MGITQRMDFTGATDVRGLADHVAVDTESADRSFEHLRIARSRSRCPATLR